jgi:hypothetical protein
MPHIRYNKGHVFYRCLAAPRTLRQTETKSNSAHQAEGFPNKHTAKKQVWICIQDTQGKKPLNIYSYIVIFGKSPTETTATTYSTTAKAEEGTLFHGPHAI